LNIIAAISTKEIMDEFVPELKKFYYDETKYDSYLEQLGVDYPTVKKKKD
jgi:aminobenzoyl-glutamate utilization protein B